jgi:acetyl-CoA carboxylase, biotin carboxylase subunit
VLADAHGHVVHCYERECSLQRRRQKIFEEAPAPRLPPGLRDQMTAAAVRLARQVGYTSAGTVEFLVDGEEFYFMEMNTRIQVEHPVTEMVTGLDLVAEQLRVAAGEPLSVRQEDVVARGHAVECRINAEDPARRFLPKPGTVSTLEVPGGPGVRMDHALAPGAVVPPFYDSLVAKLCAWGTDRPQALARAGQALAELEIGGLTTTAPLHRRLLTVPDVVRGDYHTAWLEEFLATAGG